MSGDQDWHQRERRQFCSAHPAMLDHDERMSNALAAVETKLKGIYWLAGAVFLVALGSIGAVISVGYQSGAVVQSVRTNTEQVKSLADKIDRHIERTIK